MFENFRQSLQDLFSRGVQPHERRAILSSMKETLVQAKAGVADLRDGLERTRARLAAEERELETVRRRKALAQGINDLQTVGVAEKYEQLHQERATMLAEKARVQEQELMLVEREVGEMTQALKGAMQGVPPAGIGQSPADAQQDAMRELDEELAGPDPSAELDALRRTRARADRDADAARRLEELKRRMGK